MAAQQPPHRLESMSPTGTPVLAAVWLLLKLSTAKGSQHSQKAQAARQEESVLSSMELCC